MNLEDWIFSEELPGYTVVKTVGQGSFGEVHFSLLIRSRLRRLPGVYKR